MLFRPSLMTVTINKTTTIYLVLYCLQIIKNKDGILTTRFGVNRPEKVKKREQEQAPVPVRLKILREEYAGLCVLCS